jgi:fibronectin type 3 domain-containing protein
VGRWRAAIVIGTALALASAVAAPAERPAAASAWGVGLTSGRGEGRAGPAPPAPQNAAASCASPLSNQIDITWSPVPAASSYSVYVSTSSSSSGYTPAASGITTTAWADTGVATGNDWFEVTAVQGQSWEGQRSGPTGETTVVVLTCTQP